MLFLKSVLLLCLCLLSQGRNVEKTSTKSKPSKPRRQRGANSGDGLGLSLWMASSTGDLDGVNTWLETTSTEKLNERGSGGQTPLMAACLAGHADVVMALLEAGADPSVGEQQKYTCLHGAGFQGRASVIRAIHASRFAGVVPNAPHEDDGFAPIHRAAWGREPRHAEALQAFLDIGVPHDLAAASTGETPRDLALKTNFKGTLEVLDKFHDKSDL
jgi:hypothetical protein